jgi:hypothetical protein
MALDWFIFKSGVGLALRANQGRSSRNGRESIDPGVSCFVTVPKAGQGTLRRYIAALPGAASGPGCSRCRCIFGQKTADSSKKILVSWATGPKAASANQKGAAYKATSGGGTIREVMQSHMRRGAFGAQRIKTCVFSL